MNVCFTVDMEQDCPPYRYSWRGLEEGTPRLLALLEEVRVPATLFTTGEAARRYPKTVCAIVAAGHELGCHGDLHRSFATLNEEDAQGEIDRATATLRQFYPVTAFRAPYLKFPRRYLPLLQRAGYRVDSSEAKYKAFRAAVGRVDQITRVPASVTSSLLRWPAALRNRVLSVLDNPVVLFVHPWEFVDFRHEKLRLDCRFRTGAEALRGARETIQFFKDRGAEFVTMRRYAAG